MASQWFYNAHADHQGPNAKRGPVSFQQLAQLIADGELTSDSVACRETGEDWQPVDHIVGLSRAVDKIRRRSPDRKSTPKSDDARCPARAATTIPSTAETPANQSSASECDESAPPTATANRQLQRLLIGLASLVGFVLLFGWWIRPRWERFPTPAHLQNSPQPGGWHLPLLGQVNGFEFCLLLVDAAIVLMAITWWLRHRDSNEPKQAGRDK